MYTVSLLPLKNVVIPISVAFTQFILYKGLKHLEILVF